MKINWKVRVKSPAFWLGLIGVIMSPILAYFGMTYADLTSWDSLGQLFSNFIKNPYLIGTVILALLSFIGVVVDPTTKGLGDTNRAMAYIEPGSDDSGNFYEVYEEPVGTPESYIEQEDADGDRRE